jgi:hypothetical protein
MWSYSGDPSTSDRDQVRFYIGDTLEERQLLTDEEIEHLLAQWAQVVDSPLYVAAVACETLSVRFAADIDVSADGVSVAQSQLQQKFNEAAVSLRDQYKALHDKAGPLRSAEFNVDDPTVPPLTFGVGFMDNALAGLQDYGDERRVW